VSTPRETVSAFAGIVSIQAGGLAYKKRVRKRVRKRIREREREREEKERGSAKSVGVSAEVHGTRGCGRGHPNRSHLLGGALREQ